MIRMTRNWWLTGLALLLGMQASFGQTPAPAYVPSSPGTIAAALYPDGSRPAHASSDPSLEDRNGRLLKGDSYLDGPRVCNLGWFASADLDFLGPHVNNQLTAPVAVGLRTDSVMLPAAALHWAVSPRFEVGYRFGEAAGELLVSYRFLGSNGQATTPGFDALGNAGLLRSRLNTNVIDLDYAKAENSLLPNFDMRWRVGIRMASLFFDSRETSPALQQRESNHFLGAGPHAALELVRPLADRRVGLFCKIEAAGVLGEVRQHFEETVLGATGATRQSQYMPTFMLGVQAGVTWTPNDAWRFSAGYSYEQWWDATFAGNSRGDVLMQGIFLRGEWKY